VLTEDRWAGRVTITDFSNPVTALGRVRVPRNFNPRSASERRDLAASLRTVRVEGDVRRPSRGKRGSEDEREIDYLRHEMRKHPCHGCPEREDHARWAERRHRLERDTESLRAKVANRTGSLARMFDQVCTVLADRGYLDDAGVTPAGRMLARIWTEADLLVAEAIRTGLWDELSPAELAAAVSVAVYESRRDSEERAAVPYGAISTATDATLQLWRDLLITEHGAGLELTREPDLGFVWPIFRWARGEALSKVLASAHNVDGDMPAGDFVRWARQVIDLLGQIAEAAGGPSDLRDTARAAQKLLNRGVLAYAAMA
jgi:ATP-dependent RNA helicase HelY